ncbi:TetR family transcriptional regulator [Kineococcus sp. R8]|uniref:TetR/AcrR family transcriptional regulator n=1 Tax=Kineococcus siccus TaxID=2696567 RepID=UPI001411DA5A|nr:TetR/AcrR family transcriptional regulator [Kineococcus siccus]NAZ82255.1 TetR family transcriptional regulator [Kineococcus siccus]
MTTNHSAPAPDVEAPLEVRRARAPRARSQRQLEENARNRAEIVHAAVRVFAENGYATTTLDAIAKLVGLTRPGVLYHFSSKDALFEAVIADQENWARQRFIGDDGAKAGDALRTLHSLVPFIGRDDDSRVRLQMVQMLQGEAMSGHPAAQAFATRRLANVRRQIRSRLERAVEVGELRDGLDLEALATLVSATINGLQAQWLLDDRVDTAAAFEQLLQLVSAPATRQTRTADS